MHNYAQGPKIEHNVLPSVTEEPENSPAVADDIEVTSSVLPEPEFIPTSVEPGVSDPILINAGDTQESVTDNKPLIPIVGEDVTYDTHSDKAGETSFFCLNSLMIFALFIIIFAIAFSYLQNSKSSFGANVLAPTYHIKSAFKIAN